MLWKNISSYRIGTDDMPHILPSDLEGSIIQNYCANKTARNPANHGLILPQKEVLDQPDIRKYARDSIGGLMMFVAALICHRDLL